MNASKMAWRNIWRNRRRSLITMAAIGFALLAMTVYSGLMRGYLDGLELSILDYEVGDAQIFAAGYRDKPSIYSGIASADRLLERLDQAGFPSSPRLLAGGLAAAGDTSAGVSLRGIDVARDARVGRIAEQIADGAWLDPAHPDHVVIGRRLARTLGVTRGAEIVILTQGADGSMANQVYTVRGVLHSIADGTDRTGVFMTAAAFRTLLAYDGGPHQLIVRRPPRTPPALAEIALRRVAGSIEAGDAARPVGTTGITVKNGITDTDHTDHASLGGIGTATAVSPGGTSLDVKTWRQLLPTLASLLDASKATMYVLMVIVYLAIAIVILNAMLMAVFERIRELGMLKAIGMGPFTVLRLVLLESLMQTALAVGAALALALPAVYYLARVGIDQGRLADASLGGIARDPIWRASFAPGVFVGPTVALLVIVTLAVIYPAVKAARLPPVEAMRHR